MQLNDLLSTQTNHYRPIPERFRYPDMKPSTRYQPLSMTLFPQLLATTKLLPVSIDFLILHISCKWNHTACGLLYLASFI